MAEVLYTESALLDLDNIYEYYGRYSRERGDQFSEKLSETIYLLAAMPLLGRSRDDLLNGLRMFVHDRHVIFYTQTETSILIERVASPYQDYEGFFE